MSRQPRLDAPGALPQVMGRGIERAKMFRNEIDRTDLLGPIGYAMTSGALKRLRLNPHVKPFSSADKDQESATGLEHEEASYWPCGQLNRRHNRNGHLFQNRYKYIVCEDDPLMIAV